MSKLANNLFFAIALLLSQSTLALHEIHCLDEEHTESCQVCTTHDQSACNPVNQNKSESISFQGEQETLYLDASLQDIISLYQSRAPPHYI